MASLAKARDPRLITVFGGPNFPLLIEEKLAFLLGRPNLDFYVELEGELGFKDLVDALADKGFDGARLKEARIKLIYRSFSRTDSQLKVAASA